MQLGEWSNGVSKHILKIEDGKNVVGVFRGEVVRFYQHWANGRSTICPGRDTCALCASPDEDTRKATGRFRINFIAKEATGLTARVFEGGRRVYSQLEQINKDIPLESVWVRIARTGKGNQTQYMITVLPGEAGMVKAAENKAIVAVELHDISLNRDAEEEAEVETA